MKIKFIEERTVKANPPHDKTFEEGKVYELNPDSCNHWIKRGVAVVAKSKKQDVKEDVKDVTKAEK